MGRRPEVFVRPIWMAEGQRLQRIGRTAKDPVRLRRSIVVLMSAQGQPAPDIAHLLKCSVEYVRGVVHDFNERGFAALDPKWSGGRPKKINEQIRREICLIARCCPRDLGLPFAAWSLAKLAGHVTAIGLVPSISRETVRRVLHAGGVSWQATKTWKASADPDFMAKMRRVLDLYDRPPADGRVVCVDEFGPLNLQPRPGRAWRPVGQPGRLRATYHRYGGVRHMLAALDLATRKDELPDPAAETLAGVPRLRQGATSPLARPEAVPDRRQLLPAPAPHRAHLGRRQRRRAGLPAHLRLLAELDRIRVRRPALLSPSTAPTTPTTPNKPPPSPTTSAGATPAQNPKPPSPPAQSSAPGPITRSTLHDGATCHDRHPRRWPYVRASQGQRPAQRCVTSQQPSSPEGGQYPWRTP
jgi:transposase